MSKRTLFFSGSLAIIVIGTSILILGTLIEASVLTTMVGILLNAFGLFTGVLQLFFPDLFLPKSPTQPKPGNLSPQRNPPTRSRRRILALLATFGASAFATSIAWFAILSRSSYSPTTSSSNREQTTATTRANAHIPGKTWHTQSYGTSELQGISLRGIAWLDSQFVAVGDRGTILTSPNGSVWIARQPGISQGLSDVAWSGSQFVAVGGNVSPKNSTILTSPNAIIWTTQHSGTSDFIQCVVWSGSQFVVAGGSVEPSRGTILTSPSGNIWTPQLSGTSQILRGVAWSGSQFVGVGNGGTIL